MNTNQNKTKSLKKAVASKKFRYGAAATALTVLFCAAVILLNVIVSAVDSKVSLYFDLTRDEIFTIGDDSVKLVRDQLDQYRSLHGEEPQILISFLSARDKIMGDKQKSWVVNLFESYAERFDAIRVEYREDLKTHPENYTDYTNLGYDINANSILVSNALEKGSFRYMTFDSCLVYDENGERVWAFQGEMKLNAAILYLTKQKSPVVSFLTGHGESVPQTLTEILTNSGFSIENVDLSKDDISPSAKFVILCNPQKDITYSENDLAETEYTKLSRYLNAYRSLVVIMSPSTPRLPVLDELLADWGLSVERNAIVMDDVNCHTKDNQMIYVDYAKTDSVAALLTDSLTKLSTPPRTLSIETAPITILDEGDGSSSVAEPILYSSEHSYVEKLTEEGKVTEDGPFPVMAISTRFTYIDNAKTYGHLIVIGSQNFTETNAFREQFGNTDIVYNMIRLLSDEDIVMETDYKILDDYAITMDSGEMYVYGVIAAVVIPLVIFAFGAVVYFKRKNL